jgi:plastocyanin
MRRSILALAAAGALSVGLVPVASAAAPAVVHLSAPVSGLRYTQKVLHAHHGKIKIVFQNHSTLKHNVYVELGEKELGHSATVAQATTSFVVKLAAGKYNYYCNVPGHEDAGMHGTLVVS